MSTKHLMVTVSFFFVGIGLGLFLQPVPAGGAVVPPDFGAEVDVTEVFDPETGTACTPKHVRIVPHRVIEDGKVRDVSDERRSRYWIVSADGGRVQIHGTSD